MNNPESAPSVSVIVPTFREAENLPLLVPRVAAILSGGSHVVPAAWELIVVDDNSRDGTEEYLRSIQQQWPQVRYLVRTKERGLSSAVLAGMAMAKHDIVLVMDADLSHPPEAIPAMLERLARGDADFVIGSRYVDGGGTEDWSRLRWLNSAGATALARPLAGRVRDPMAGFFALPRALVAAADTLSPIGYKIALELLVKTRVPLGRVAEVPITFRNRVHGTSKLTIKEQFRYLEHLSRLYDYKFPKASPRGKFLIAGACGAATCAAVVAAYAWLGIPAYYSFAVGLLAMILITLAFFVRYVHTQRDFIVMKRPYVEFTCISVAELLAGWAVAVVLPGAVVWKLAAALGAVMVVRYTLRKVFLHDLRGIRGTRRAAVAPPPPPIAPIQPTPGAA